MGLPITLAHHIHQSHTTQHTPHHTATAITTLITTEVLIQMH